MDKRGVTLIELTLVIAIIGIAVMCIVPSTKMISQTKLEATAKDMYLMVKTTQQLAHATNNRYLIECDGTYVNIRVGRDDGKIEYRYRVPEGIRINVGNKGDSQTTNNLNSFPIVFNGDMSPSPAGTITIIDEKTNKRRWVSVRVATGKATLYENWWQGE